MAPAAIPSRSPILRAMAVAEHYWRATACGGQIAVHAYEPLAAGLDPSTEAWATYSASLEPNEREGPPSTYLQCTIFLARQQWPSPTAIEHDWNMFCLTVIHEVGHLLGHPHSLVPRSVMAPVFTSEANVPEICRASRASSATVSRTSQRLTRHR